MSANDNNFDAPPLSPVTMHSVNCGPHSELVARVNGDNPSLCATISTDTLENPEVLAAWKTLAQKIGAHLHNLLVPDNPIAHIIDLTPPPGEKLQ